jgi:8-amino-7-oxononanoate synthase
MATLGKAYGSYGAYILASNHIINFLENRAKSIIYSTAPSLFDIAYAYTNLKYIQKNKKRLRKKISKYQNFIYKKFNIKLDSLILPITIDNNKKVISIQKELLKKNILVGAIRQPTVKKAMLRVIIKLDIKLRYYDDLTLFG